MEIETISKVEILDNEEIYLVLSSGGKDMYQYIYREAADVYWDNDRKAFKAPAPRKWSHSDWYHHIVSLVASSLKIDLELTNKTNWINVSPQTKNEICSKKDT